MIEIDLMPFWQFVYMAGRNGPLWAAWTLFFQYYGWVLFVYFLIRYPIFSEYMDHIQGKWASKQKYTILAIDVPRNNETSVQAMEEFFIHLLGAHGSTTKYEQYVEGKFQLSFSLEIVSLEGNIQYLIRTPSKYRDLVESGIYAQFPDAEITEVEDYTAAVPQVWPNDTHDLWGTEFTLDNGNWYPIKTYRKFEDPLTKAYIDPLAALLESMSKIGPGEQMWLQLIITPQGADWAKDAEVELQKAKGKYKPKPSLAQEIMGTVGSEAAFVFNEVGQIVGLGTGGEEAKEEKAVNPLLLMTPGEREKLKSMEEKISKLAFACKMRYIYLSSKENMNKDHGVNPIIGAIKQWGVLGINGFKPALKQTGTRANYVFVEQRLKTRKTYIFNGYKKRSGQIGIKKFFLNVEELASFWHFPTIFVKTPTVSTTKLKKTEAPVSLPFEAIPTKKEEKKKKSAPPTPELPPIDIDLDDDSFEMKFAKNKSQFQRSNTERKERLTQPTRMEPSPVIPEQSTEVDAHFPGDDEPPTTPANTGSMRAPDNLPF